MHFLKKNINGSPFLGVFLAASNKFVIAPKNISKKEETEIQETMQARIVKTSLANSSLNGVISVVFEDKIIVPEMVEKHEKKALADEGLEVKQFDEPSAFGNLVALNKSGGIASPVLRKKTVQEIQDFFGVKFSQKDLGGSSLCGSSLKVSNKGFVANPHINQKEFEFLEKTFDTEGVLTTANFGDRFVGNDLIVNDFGAIIGSITTTHEMIRIDEALRRD